MSDLRIYIAISTFHPFVGGAEKQAMLQARSLRERGHQVTIITFHHEKRWQVHEVIEGVPVMRVAGRLLGEREKYPRVLQRLVYLLALLVMGWTLWQHRHRYELLHVYQLTLLALSAALVCRLTGKPLVVAVRSALLPGGKQTSDPIIPLLRVDKTTRVIHDLADLERFGWLVVRFTRFLLSCKLVMIVVLSSRMREYMTAYDFNLPNIQLIPNGVDTRRFQVIQATCAARVGNYADNLLDDHSQTVVCVSRLSYEKGIDVLLQAWQLVHKEVPQAKLVIVGDGPLEAQLVDMVKALGIAESVEFMGVQHDVAAQLHRSSIAVLPSRREGMPNAVLEAMACGLPCVATRVSGSEDIIEQGVNGLLVEIEDFRDMARTLLALLRDEALTRRMGYAARATIEQRFSLERVTDSYIKLYNNLIGMR